MISASHELGSEFEQVVVQDHRDRIRPVAVHVDKGVETVFGAGEEPVYGPFLVTFEMVLIEILEKVFADVFSDGLFNEGQIFLVMGLPEGQPQKPVKPPGGISFETPLKIYLRNRRS